MAVIQKYTLGYLQQIGKHIFQMVNEHRHIDKYNHLNIDMSKQ